MACFVYEPGWRGRSREAWIKVVDSPVVLLLVTAVVAVAAALLSVDQPRYVLAFAAAGAVLGPAATLWVFLTVKGSVRPIRGHWVPRVEPVATHWNLSLLGLHDHWDYVSQLRVRVERDDGVTATANLKVFPALAGNGTAVQYPHHLYGAPAYEPGHTYRYRWSVELRETSQWADVAIGEF